MSNAITEAHSIEAVVDVIKQSHTGVAPEYFGGYDTRSAEEMAAQYALDCAMEQDCIEEANIEAHMDILRDAGAEFDFGDALEMAVANARRIAAEEAADAEDGE